MVDPFPVICTNSRGIFVMKLPQRYNNNRPLYEASHATQKQNREDEAKSRGFPIPPPLRSNPRSPSPFRVPLHPILSSVDRFFRVWGSNRSGGAPFPGPGEVIRFVGSRPHFPFLLYSPSIPIILILFRVSFL